METSLSSRAWNLIVAGLALEILIAAIAIWVKATGSCGNCGATSPAGAAVGGAGALFYMILLATALWIGPTTLLFVGIFVGFAVHAALIFLMISSGPVCPPCVLASAVSAVLFVSCMLYDRANLRRAALVLPVAAVLLQAGSLVYGLVKSSALAEARSDVTTEAAKRDGVVRIVIFETPDCPYCQILERDVLPVIEKDFGSRIRVIRRPGSDIPGLALPTVIVIGDQEEIFEGLPTVALLSAAVRRALTTLEGGRPYNTEGVGR